MTIKTVPDSDQIHVGILVRIKRGDVDLGELDACVGLTGAVKHVYANGVDVVLDQRPYKVLHSDVAQFFLFGWVVKLHDEALRCGDEIMYGRDAAVVTGYTNDGKYIVYKDEKSGAVYACRAPKVVAQATTQEQSGNEKPRFMVGDRIKENHAGACKATVLSVEHWPVLSIKYDLPVLFANITHVNGRHFVPIPPSMDDTVRVHESCAAERLRGTIGVVFSEAEIQGLRAVAVKSPDALCTSMLFVSEVRVIDKNFASKAAPDQQAVTAAQPVLTPPSLTRPTLDQRLIAIGKKHEDAIPQIEIMRKQLRETLEFLLKQPKAKNYKDVMLEEALEAEVKLVERGDTGTYGWSLDSAYSVLRLRMRAIETAIAVRDAAAKERPHREPARIEPLELRFDVSGDDDP